jgi:hypothetical protein
MPCTALFTLDLDDAPSDERHNHVGNNTAFATKIMNVFSDLHFDSHIRNPHESNIPSLQASSF